MSSSFCFGRFKSFRQVFYLRLHCFFRVYRRQQSHLTLVTAIGRLGAWQVAIEKGWFKEAGVDVKFKWFDYSASLDAFSAGKLDAVLMTNGDALVYRCWRQQKQDDSDNRLFQRQRYDYCQTGHQNTDRLRVRKCLWR